MLYLWTKLAYGTTWLAPPDDFCTLYDELDAVGSYLVTDIQLVYLDALPVTHVEIVAESSFKGFSDYATLVLSGDGLSRIASMHPADDGTPVVQVGDTLFLYLRRSMHVSDHYLIAYGHPTGFYVEDATTGWMLDSGGRPIQSVECSSRPPRVVPDVPGLYLFGLPYTTAVSNYEECADLCSF